jgi:lipopolysaccharide export system protein LptA
MINMQYFRPKCLQHYAGIALLVFLSCSTVHAQTGDPRLPISLDADSTDYDGKSSMLMFRGLRLTQGSIGIEADDSTSKTVSGTSQAMSSSILKTVISRVRRRTSNSQDTNFASQPLRDRRHRSR